MYKIFPKNIKELNTIFLKTKNNDFMIFFKIKNIFSKIFQYFTSFT